MASKATVRDKDGVSIVDLSGRIVLGDGSQIIRDTVKGLLEKGQKRILLNLAEVTYIDSAGLGELVGSFVTTTNQGAKLKLLNVAKRARDVLQVTKLYTVFETFDDEAKAIASFRTRGAAA